MGDQYDPSDEDGPKRDEEEARAIGRRIKQARQEAGGMTQRELADLVGVTERSIASWEAGDVVPHRFMRKLSDYLERPTEWFYSGDKEPSAFEAAVTEKLDAALELLRNAGLRGEQGGPAFPTPPAGQSDTELLIKLGDMRQRELLTDEEFKAAKARLLEV